MTGELTGKLLIAMPQLMDSRFHHSLIYICGHDEKGAMGIVINRAIETHTLSELMTQLNLEGDFSHLEEELVFFGGPVEIGRGFVLHSNDYDQEGTVKVSSDINLTATLDILSAIAQGEGPHQRLCALGYAGWSAGQLEGEIQSNCWLQTDASLDMLFEIDPEMRWEKALESMGIHPELLSTDAGHA